MNYHAGRSRTAIDFFPVRISKTRASISHFLPYFEGLELMEVVLANDLSIDPFHIITFLSMILHLRIVGANSWRVKRGKLK